MAHAHRRGAVFIPTLSRMIVGVLFVLMGAQACFQDVTLTPSQVATLQEHGIMPTHSEAVGSGAVEGATAGSGQEESAGSSEDAVEAGDAGGAGVRGVYAIAADLASMQLSHDMTLPWVVAITQFTAGVLLLVGLFVRLWAAILMVLSVWWMAVMGFVQWDLKSISPLEWVNHPLGLMTVIAFAGSAVMAMSLVASGGGPLSLDRGLFGGSVGTSKRPLAAADPASDDLN